MSLGQVGLFMLVPSVHSTESMRHGTHGIKPLEVAMYPSHAFGWSEPLSQMIGQGSLCQAAQSMLATVLPR
jgi:hypothetical protein